mgnify:CR=1 FL=1
MPTVAVRRGATSRTSTLTRPMVMFGMVPTLALKLLVAESLATASVGSTDELFTPARAATSAAESRRVFTLLASV